MVVKVNQTFSDRAFLIRSVTYGDAHRILSFFTAQFGKMDLIAYAAKKSSSRFSGLLDYLHCLQIEYRSSPRGKLSPLLGCQLVQSYPKIRQDFDRSWVALQWMKLITKALSPQQHVERLFSFVQAALHTLEFQNPNWVDLLFRKGLLSRLGYQLELSQCLQCGEKNAKGYFFSPGEGGLLCTQCQSSAKGIFIPYPFPDSFWSWSHPSPLLQKEQEVGWGHKIVKAGFRFCMEIEE